MANDYFEHSTPLVRHTLARAEAVNAIMSGVESGFDALPAERELKEGRVTWGEDTGAANAYVVTLPYAPADYQPGFTIRFIPANSCTGASTINVNGLGAKSVLRASGSAVTADDIVAGMVLQLTYDGAAFRISGAPTQSGVPSHSHAQSDVTNLTTDLATLAADIASLTATVATKADTSSLAAVALTGAYTDLTGEPTGVEDGATADQTDAEIETAYNNQVAIVTQEDAEAGIDTTAKRWTAERVAQAIAALSPARLSSAAVAIAPIDSDTFALTADNWAEQVVGEAVVYTVNWVLNTTPSDPVAITLPADDDITPAGTRFLFVQDLSQTGLVTIEPEAGGTLNGGTDPITLGGPGSPALVIVESNAGTAPNMQISGDLRVARTVYGATTFADGIDFADSTAAQDSRDNLEVVRVLRCKLTTTFDPASATLQDVTGMSFPVVTGHYYQYEFCAVFQTATATVGPKFAITHPGGNNKSMLWAQALTASTVSLGAGFYESAWSSSGAAQQIPDVPATGNRTLAIIKGCYECTSSGTLQLQFANESGTTDCTMRSGSTGLLWDLGT